MSRLYLFNPDHDLALANGSKTYDAPASARQFASDLACLPLWYADEGSRVMAPVEFRAWKSPLETLLPRLATISFAEADTAESLVPWGWNQTLGRYSDSIAQTFIDNVREHSHRRWSGRAMDFLRNRLSFPVPDSATELFSRGEVDDFLRFHPKAILKAPISGSGRGVWRCFGGLSQSAEGWCRRTLCRQGSVMGEPLYHKVQDFAMEFLLKNGKASFAGYSVFETEAMGVYSANILAADDELERRLSEYIPLSYLHEIQDALLLFFEREYSFYEGYLGVDMLIYEENGRCLVNPMIEINLRMTMGMVARRFFDAFVCDSSTGVFRIDRFDTTDELQAHCRTMQANAPLKVRDNRIQSGYITLCPITPNTKYSVSVLMGQISHGDATGAGTPKRFGH